MTWPTLVTVVDTETPGVSGYLTYQLIDPLTNSSTGAVYPDIARQVRYNSSGVASIQLAVIDDGTTIPTGASYTVVKAITGAPSRTWIIQPLAAMAPTVSLGSITPVTPLPPVLPYATSISVGTTTTGAPGTNAAVTNTGTTAVPVFAFTIPRGAVGATGSAGTNGTNGTNGSTWFEGSGAPSAGTGVNGDYYFRTDTSDIYLKAAGSWSQIANIKGATGAQGATGNTGNTGPSGTNAAVFVLTDATSITTDASLGNLATVTLGGNRTMANPTNPTSGQKLIYRILQDGTGSRTLTWGAAFRFGVDIPQPTLTTTPNKTDYLAFAYNAASSTWDCVGVSRGY